MADADDPVPDDAAEMSLLEWEQAMANEAHPRHAEAERIIETTFRPGMQKISKSLMPKLPSGGFASLGRIGLGNVTPKYPVPSLSPQGDIVPSHERVSEMMDEYIEAIASKEAQIAAEKDEERKQRQADQVEARRQHRVMVALTVVTGVLTLIATVAAVVAIFVSAP